MSGQDLVMVVISAINTVAVVGTLWVVVRYTRETVRLAEAAVEQMPRPCVDLASVRDSSTETALENLASSLANSSTLVFRNCGTGPAINLRWTIAAHDAKIEALNWTKGPNHAAGEAWESTHPKGTLPSAAKVVIDYESLGGTHYRSQMRVDDRRWVRAFEFTRYTKSLSPTTTRQVTIE
jgi:hypothetical protein